VLPGQGLRTSEVVTDAYGAMAERLLTEEARRNAETNLVQCHLMYHESHMKSPRPFRRHRGKKPAPNRLRYSTAYRVK
jgi:hypothetical protein